jgi:uncharacterized membrane protein (DUF2068 family)
MGIRLVHLSGHLLAALVRLAKPELVDHLYDWLYSLTDSFERRLLERALDWVDSLGAARIHNIVIVTSAYTAILLAEGIGLMLRKTWAEWLTVIASSSLIPFELWHLFFGVRHNKWAVLAATLLNVVIVIVALAIAAAVERDSEHTIAQGVVKSAEERGLSLPTAERFQAIPGLGVQADVNGRQVLIGEKILISVKEASSTGFM